MTVMTGVNKHCTSTDAVLDDLGRVLAEYEQVYTGAETSLYRAYPGVVHVRVFDDRLAGLSIDDRHGRVWRFLESRAADASMAEIYLLTALSRVELAEPFHRAINDEFENPQPYDP